MDIDLPLILSLIGSITGCAGLAINFHKFLTEQFKLKIYFGEYDNIFFEKIKNSNYKTNFHGIIRINFVNKSSAPVTIYEIVTKLNNKLLTHRIYEDNEIILINEVYTNHKYKSLVFPMDKQIEIPLRLGPFDSYEGFLFFPFFPDTFNKYETINFTFKTTKGLINKKHQLIKFETKVHNKCNNDYI